jgi:hypothetical protein
MNLATPTKAELPEGERVLLEMFRFYLEEIFDHDASHSDATFADLMILHAFDDVDAAGLLADSEFGGERAGYLCRRASLLHNLSRELTEFFAASSAAEREALPTIRSARQAQAQREELEREHPELYGKLRARAIAEADRALNSVAP